MPKNHIVRQGENLSSIARRYKNPRWQDIYDDPANAEFRSLRPNPNLIYPGDRLVIPDIEPQHAIVATDQTHRFVVRRNKQTLRVRLHNMNGESLKCARVEAHVGDEIREPTPDSDGIVEVEITTSDPSEIMLCLFMSDEDTVPRYRYQIRLNHLDPLDTISGIQARLNALRHPAGAVDGVMGKKTRAGVASFQRSTSGLAVDGVPGPKTQTALADAYGC